jgi:hypothetical protein
MITGQILKEFAENNNLTIPPYRDYDECAALINKRNGACPCHPETRTCPCSESLEEIRNAPTDDVACCTCRFYCDQRYIAHWGETWKRQGIIKKQNKEETKTYQVRREIKNPETKQIIETLDRAARKLDKDDCGEATDILANEAERTECGICKQFLGTEASRMQFLDAEFNTDMEAYKKDKRRALERLEEIREIYVKVDESLDIDNIKGNDRTITSTTHRDDFHRCLSDVMTHPTMRTELPQSKERFKAANMYCAGKTKTMTEAIELLRGP